MVSGLEMCKKLCIQGFWQYSKNLEKLQKYIKKSYDILYSLIIMYVNQLEGSVNMWWLY